jgi:hypothetical protein
VFNDWQVLQSEWTSGQISVSFQRRFDLPNNMFSSWKVNDKKQFFIRLM